MSIRYNTFGTTRAADYLTGLPGTISPDYDADADVCNIMTFILLRVGKNKITVEKF